MGDQLALPAAQLEPWLTTYSQKMAREPAWLGDYLAAAERAYARIREPGANATNAAYKSAWRRWGLHCGALGLDPLPVRPDPLVSYLELLSRSKAPNTIRLTLAALVSLDQAYRAERHDEGTSLRKNPRVQRWLSSWSREHSVKPRKQAPAIGVPALDRMLAAAAEPRANLSARQHVALYTRDRAMLLLGVGAALRVSELVALAVEDVQLVDRGLRVFVRRSKTDQAGHGHFRGVMRQARVARCPVEAWRAWLQLRGDAPGSLFGPIARDGGVLGVALTARQAQEMIARRARDAGIDGVTSHSMRTTFVTLACERGARLEKIADQCGHKSLNTSRIYMRQASLFDDNASAGLLDL